MARVLVPLADGSEELEAVTVIDLLRRAEIDVTVAGIARGPVRASRGTRLLPDTELAAVLEDDFDMIVLPGGLPGADNLNQDPRVHQLLRRMSAAGKYTAAICAAPKVLAEAGLLDNRKFTSYPGALQGSTVPWAETTGSAVEIDGKVVTSRGPGTAMDFALELIELLTGRERRQSVETGLQR